MHACRKDTDNRLRFHHNTTLRKEVEKLIGVQKTPLSLPKVKDVVFSYLRRGETFKRRHFRIPELDMTNANLRQRLRKDFGVELSVIIAEVENDVQSLRLGA